MKNILLFLAIWSLISCNESSNTIIEEKPHQSANVIVLTQEQLRNAKVITGKLSDQKLSGTIRVSGKMDVPPQNLVIVSAPLGGYLKSTRLIPGMKVSKGEVIAEIEDQQYIQLQQDFLTTRVQLDMAEKNYLRQKELNESKASSDKIFQQAFSDYQSLKIQRSALSEKLKLIHINPETLNENTLSRSIKIHAPFSGYVTKVNAGIGAYISPTDMLVELIDPSDAVLKLNVFEKDLLLLSAGQRVLAYTNVNPDVKYECEVYLVSRDIAEDGSAEVHCRFLASQPDLLPGMYLNAEIEVNDRTVPAAPDAAVVSFEGSEFLFVRRGPGEFEMVQVSCGQREDGWIEVLNAETFAGREVVMEGAYTLLMSLKNTAEE